VRKAKHFRHFINNLGTTETTLRIYEILVCIEDLQGIWWHNFNRVRSAATGNARSPTVDSRVDGTSNADVDDDRRRCRPGILATGWRASAR